MKMKKNVSTTTKNLRNFTSSKFNEKKKLLVILGYAYI